MSATLERLKPPIKISVVSYANSYPFLYGLEHHPISSSIDLQLDNPAECARKLKHGDVELGLVPVAILPELDDYYIVSNACIGADGPVESVCLFSEVPLNEVETVLLDYQSRTSVQLVRFLAQNSWQITPKWENAQTNFIGKIQGTTAGVVIGDRAFPLLDKFPVVKDLSEEWKAHTNLPFVFACWVSNKKLGEEFEQQFQEAIDFGLQNKLEAITHFADVGHSDLARYVELVISYELDDKKRQALDLFLNWLNSR